MLGDRNSEVSSKAYVDLHKHTQRLQIIFAENYDFRVFIFAQYSGNPILSSCSILNFLSVIYIFPFTILGGGVGVIGSRLNPCTDCSKCFPKRS